MQGWITDTIANLGYWGIGLLMLLENLFPPIPSELIMPLAGFTIAQGKMEFLPVIMAGLIGSLLGAIPWYYLGKLIGEENIYKLINKYGKWLQLNDQDLDKAQHWFNKYGELTVLFGRLIPGVRTLISLPAGLKNMWLVSFLFYSLIGSAIWVSLLTIAGYFLGNNYHLVEDYLAPISKVVFGLIIAMIILWVWKRKNSSK
jgi:membrane protein DedA with SNARE-associated domain